MKVTKGSAYRKGKTKLVELPSVIEGTEEEHPVFKIRKPTPGTAVKLYRALGLELPTTAESEAEAYEQLEESSIKVDKELLMANIDVILDILLTDCVIDPKIVLEATDDPEDIPVYEIPDEDSLELFKAIWDFSPWSKKAQEERSFLPEVASEGSQDS